MTAAVNERIWCLDYARIITAFLVVLGHILPLDSNVRLFIYSFHMPLFFVISGMLHKDNYSLINSVKKYFLVLIVPLLFFCSILFIYYTIIGRAGGGILLRNTIYAFLKTDFISLNPPIWFLLVLFNVKVYFSLTSKIRSYWIHLCIWAILLIISFWGDYCYFGPTVMALPFYYFGLYYKKSIIRIYNKATYSWGFLTILFALIVMIITKHNGLVVMNYADYGVLRFPFNIVCFYICGIIGTAMILILSSLIKNGGLLIIKLADSLITILGLQWLYISVFKILMNKFLIIDNIVIELLVSVIIVSLCYISHNFIFYIFPFALGKRR